MDEIQTPMPDLSREFASIVRPNRILYNLSYAAAFQSSFGVEGYYVSCYAYLAMLQYP